MSEITAENYVFKFGKYINMRACDIAEIKTIDKNGNEVYKGMKYLIWLCDQDWFKHKEIITQIIKNSDQEQEQDEEPKKEQKKEPKKEPKKKIIKPNIKINPEEISKTVVFQ